MSKLGAGAKTAISFELGRVYATPAAMSAIEEAGQTSGEFLQRHLGNDWGELDAQDRGLNDAAARSGEDRIFSAYELRDGISRIWVITEWDRSATTIVTPEEY